MFTALGNLCSAIQQHPISDELSKELEEFSKIAFESNSFPHVPGGDSEGDSGKCRPTIKRFALTSRDHWEAAKGVSKRLSCNDSWPTKFADFLETGACVEGTGPSKRSIIPWNQHNVPFPRPTPGWARGPFLCLRLVSRWRYLRVRTVAPRRGPPTYRAQLLLP